MSAGCRLITTEGEERRGGAPREIWLRIYYCAWAGVGVTRSSAAGMPLIGCLPGGEVGGQPTDICRCLSAHSPEKRDQSGADVA